MFLLQLLCPPLPPSWKSCSSLVLVLGSSGSMDHTHWVFVVLITLIFIFLNTFLNTGAFSGRTNHPITNKYIISYSRSIWLAACWRKTIGGWRVRLQMGRGGSTWHNSVTDRWENCVRVSHGMVVMAPMTTVINKNKHRNQQWTKNMMTNDFLTR